MEVTIPETAMIMNTNFYRGLLAIILMAVISPLNAKQACHELANFSATKLRSNTQIDFCQAFGGKAMLIVNTASQCGFTPQFKGLEALHQEYGDKLAIIGFPSDDFNQEHNDSKKVADVCYVNYGVTFTMLEPSNVKGEGANSVFQKLASKTGQQPEWNFTKYLVSADGQTVKHFPSRVKPQSDELTQQIESMIGH